VRRVVLQDISIDRGREAVQRLRMQTLRTGKRVDPTLRVVNIRERVRLRKPATRETDALSVKTHVQKCRLVIVVTGVAPEVVQLLPLEFVLDSLAVGSIPDKWKHGSDSFDEHGPLRGIGVVERGLRLTINFESMIPKFLCPRTWTQ
jgi:hypothetical protein